MESRHHAPVAAFSSQPVEPFNARCADISLLGISGPSSNTQRRRAIIFRSGGVVRLEGRSPHQTTPACWLQRAGPLAAGVL
jgi:hypothetical protein